MAEPGNGEHRDWMERLSKIGLFGAIAFMVIGAVIFSYIYGVITDAEASYTESAGEVVRNGAAAVVVAVIALLTRNGGDE